MAWKSVKYGMLCGLWALTSPCVASMVEVDAFDRALEALDLDSAAEEVQALIVAGHGSRGADRQLDAYYGRFLAAQGHEAAEIYLSRAVEATGAGPERDRLSFELARVREMRGKIDEAETAYRDLSAQAGGPALRRKATLSLARLRLSVAPQDALDLLRPLLDAASPADRWAPRLMISRAYAILGNMAESTVALQQAWIEAPLATSEPGAVTITALDLALDRNVAHDRAAAVNLAAVARGKEQFTGASQIPVCDETLRPQDSVTIGFQVEGRRVLISVVRASRPGIARRFIAPLAAVRQALDRAASYVTLRCRSAPDADVQFVDGQDGDVISWLARQGFYPPLTLMDFDSADPSVPAGETGASPDSPALAVSRFFEALSQGIQMRFSSAQGFSDARNRAEQALGVLARAGAPKDVTEPLRMQMVALFALNQNVADTAGSAALEVIDAIAARAGTVPAQAYSAFAAMNPWPLRPAQRLAVVDRVQRFFDARRVPANALLRQALELRRARIVRELGDPAGLGERLVATGLAPDLCASVEQPPSIPPTTATFSADDYPRDLLTNEITGASLVELSVNDQGRVTGSRVVASQPMGLFDTITVGRLETLVWSPAQNQGRFVACRGAVQNVVWQLPPTTNDFPMWNGAFMSD